jgi:ABC-2 type transport system ATP-binding protein
MTAALSFRYVTVRFGTAFALNRVSFDVDEGSITALLGPNGSGKSTSLAVAAGILEPGDGLSPSADAREYARRIGYVPQTPGLYDELSAIENLRFFGRLQGLRGTSLNDAVSHTLKLARLTDVGRNNVGTFSGGMKQRLSLAVALIHRPKLLLLDEPTTGLDPASRESFFADLHRLRDDGRTILVSTHHIDEIEPLCDRMIVLDRGRLTALGTPAELLNRSASGRAVLYGQVIHRLSAVQILRLNEQLNPECDLEVVGRRVRLSAPDPAALGHALAAVLSEGVTFHSYRTAPNRGDTLRIPDDADRPNPLSRRAA